MEKTRTYHVKWEIDVVASSPEKAAEQVWRQIFRREWPPEPDSACCFVVSYEDGPMAGSIPVDLENEYVQRKLKNEKVSLP